MPYKDPDKQREYFKSRREKIRGRLLEYDRERNKDPKRKAQRNAGAKRWAKLRPEKVRQYRIKREYGLTPDEYAVLLVTQNGVCAICKQPESLVKNGKLLLLCVDHDHETGIVRGLLCNHCNTALGQFKDNTDNLWMAIEYLFKHQKRTRG